MLERLWETHRTRRTRMGPPFIPKTATSEIETGLYTEGFAAILSEREAPAPISAPVEARRTMHGHRGPSSDDVRHLPALKAAALGWLLLLGSGAASWYAIVSPMQRTPTIPLQAWLRLHSIFVRPACQIRGSSKARTLSPAPCKRWQLLTNLCSR